ncbi:MAG: DUF2214 family protein [Hydrogenophilaceae bacterium]|jgi:putative membrane protein|nr:DUF2214 family protein [Hydrogenophilaceae bacterium]
MTPAILDTLFAFLHFVALLVMAGALSAEAFILRLPPSAPQMRLLVRVDAFYGASSVLLILAGLGRVLYGAKHWSYYVEEPFFWAKIGAFVLVGLTSIAPTIRFLAWRRALKADEGFTPPEAQVKAVRRIVMIEAHGLALIVLFAVFMARGYGQAWFGG